MAFNKIAVIAVDEPELVTKHNGGLSGHLALQPRGCRIISGILAFFGRFVGRFAFIHNVLLININFLL
ncbi:MAG: hypothetical protein JRI62_03305 [Deltaproteobacteria bacterium]|nr:hypothetical protein [Deltaproteobacteria bacterium]